MGKLNLQQEQFVSAYIGEANGNATEAARLAGYKQPNTQGPRLLVNVGIQDAIAEYRAAIKTRGIAAKQNRIDAANDRHRRLQQVIEERAADPWLADVPGGGTGLIVKQLKHVTHEYEKDPDDPNSKAFKVTHEQWEASVDTGLLRSMLDHEKQVAQELGEWTEKSEISGNAERPVSIRLVRQ